METNINTIKEDYIEIKSDIKVINKTLREVNCKQDGLEGVPYRIDAIDTKIGSILESFNEHKEILSTSVDENNNKFKDVDNRISYLENKDAYKALEDKKYMKKMTFSKAFDVISKLLILGLLAYINIKMGG